MRARKDLGRIKPFDPLPSGASHLFRARGIVDQFDQARGNLVGLIRWDEQAAHAMFYHHRRPALIHRDVWFGAGHALHNDGAEGLDRTGGVNKDITGEHKLWNIRSESGKGDAMLHVELVREIFYRVQIIGRASGYIADK